MPAKLTIKNGVAYLSDGVISTRTTVFSKPPARKPIFTICSELVMLFPEILDTFSDLIYKNVLRRTLAKKYVDTQCWIPRFGHEIKNGYIITSKSFVDTHGFEVKGMTHIISQLCFNGLIPEGKIVTHKCKQECCCNPDHLVVATHKKNLGDASMQHDKVKPGVQSWKITANHAALISYLLKYDILTFRKLAKVYDVSPTTIHDIFYGVTHPYTDIRWLEKKGQTYTHLDDDQLDVIKESGLNHKLVAKILGINHSTVSKNLANKFGRIRSRAKVFNLTPKRKEMLFNATKTPGGIKKLAEKWGIKPHVLYNRLSRFRKE